MLMPHALICSPFGTWGNMTPLTGMNKEKQNLKLDGRVRGCFYESSIFRFLIFYSEANGKSGLTNELRHGHEIPQKIVKVLLGSAY